MGINGDRNKDLRHLIRFLIKYNVEETITLSYKESSPTNTWEIDLLTSENEYVQMQRVLADLLGNSPTYSIYTRHMSADRRVSKW